MVLPIKHFSLPECQRCIEFSIPAVGYFLLLFRVIYLLCQILFSQYFGSACSLVYYDYDFLMLEKTEMNKTVKID